MIYTRCSGASGTAAQVGQAGEVVGTSAEPSSTPARMTGTVFVSTARALFLYVGPIVATRPHAHHAAQVIIASQGLYIEDCAGGSIRTGTTVIPPRMRHCHGACAHAAMLHLDGNDRGSRDLARRTRCETWGRDTLDISVPRAPTRDAARALVASVLSALDGGRPAQPQHPATRRMCAYLDGADDIDLAHLSREAGLSPRQMRHVFARDVGLPMRAYLRWRRVVRAATAVAAGASLTAAAAAAGFADSAHLSRVFQQQFGMAPTQGLSVVSWQMLD
jgi:AraC-like DNA-binding protein